MLVPLGPSPRSTTDLGIEKWSGMCILVSNIVEYLEEIFSTLLFFICTIFISLLYLLFYFSFNFGKFWAALRSSKVQTAESFVSWPKIFRDQNLTSSYNNYISK